MKRKSFFVVHNLHFFLLQLFVKPAVKMEVNVLAPTSVHALMVFKAHCVKTTLMNVPWSPVCTNVPQIPHVSTSLDGKFNTIYYIL